MKVLHVSSRDHLGGAFIAARRLHQAFLDHSEVDSTMIVSQALTAAPRVEKINSQFISSLRRYVDNVPLKLVQKQNNASPSVGWLPNPKLHKMIRHRAPDIIHLHWALDGFFPVGLLPKINCPVVWTFHDMWPMCGISHHEVPPNQRHREGYTKDNRPEGIGWFDLDAWNFRQKEKAYAKSNITGVVPSHWLLEQAKASLLWRDRTVRRIPNGIDTKLYKPHDRAAVRNLLDLPIDKTVILFGAMYAWGDPNKGLRELCQALDDLCRQGEKNLHLAIFGLGGPVQGLDLPFPTSYFGELRDQVSMAALYASADLTVMPSHQESFGLVALESISCGTPVVCFDTSGLRDIIDHERNGILAKPFDPLSLADGIKSLVHDPARRQELGREGREKAIREFDLKRITDQHLQLYRTVLEKTPISQKNS